MFTENTYQNDMHNCNEAGHIFEMEIVRVKPLGTSCCSISWPTVFFWKSQLLLWVGGDRKEPTSHSPAGLSRMLASRFVSKSQIQLPFSSPCRQLGRRTDRKGKGRRECSLEIRRWKWTAGINNLSNDAAPVSESIFTSSLIPERHSQTMVALEAWA